MSSWASSRQSGASVNDSQQAASQHRLTTSRRVEAVLLMGLNDAVHVDWDLAGAKFAAREGGRGVDVVQPTAGGAGHRPLDALVQQVLHLRHPPSFEAFDPVAVNAGIRREEVWIAK